MENQLFFITNGYIHMYINTILNCTVKNACICFLVYTIRVYRILNEIIEF